MAINPQELNYISDLSGEMEVMNCHYSPRFCCGFAVPAKTQNDKRDETGKDQDDKHSFSATLVRWWKRKVPEKGG